MWMPCPALNAISTLIYVDDVLLAPMVRPDFVPVFMQKQPGNLFRLSRSAPSRLGWPDTSD
eukprot:scaffold203317_cov25-Prasinocladus_malaysianus.AAC.1